MKYQAKHSDTVPVWLRIGPVPYGEGVYLTSKWLDSNNCHIKFDEYSGPRYVERTIFALRGML